MRVDHACKVIVMKHGPDIARIAALIGDPARANILSALMSGKALTASELAGEAGVSASTASSHLGRLLEGGLVKEARQAVDIGKPKRECAGRNFRDRIQGTLTFRNRHVQVRIRENACVDCVEVRRGGTFELPVKRVRHIRFG